MAKLKAQWSLNLSCECPKCQVYVNLLCDPEFWSVHENLKPCQHDDKGSRNVEVTCPLCKHEFEVDLEY